MLVLLGGYDQVVLLPLGHLDHPKHLLRLAFGVAKRHRDSEMLDAVAVRDKRLNDKAVKATDAMTPFLVELHHGPEPGGAF